jgi:hypothetical protein
MMRRLLIILAALSFSASAQFTPAPFFAAGGSTTTTFTDAQTSWGFAGWSDTAYIAGRRYWHANNTNWRGYIQGTAATLASPTTGTPIVVSVDGGTETTPTVSGGLIVLFSGLADVPHLVYLRGGLSYGGVAYTLTTGTLFSVTGSAPHVWPDATWGQIATTNDTAFPIQSTIYKQYIALPRATVSTIAGTLGIRFRQSYPSTWAESAALRFRCHCTDIWVLSGIADYWYSIDGGTITQAAAVGSANATAPTWRHVLTGLDGAAAHNYLLIPSIRSIDSGNSISPVAVAIGPATATFETLASQKTVIILGDSIAEGKYDPSVPSGSTMVYRVANTLGLMPTTWAYAGSTAQSLLASLNTGTTLWNVLNAVPDYAIVNIGRSDLVSGNASLDATGVLTVAASPTPTGTIGVGGTYVGGSINATVTALISGTGGAGTYQTNQTGSTIGLTAITGTWPNPVFQTNVKAIVDNLIAGGISKIAILRVVPDEADAFLTEQDADLATVAALYSPTVVQYFTGAWHGIHTIEFSPGVTGTHPCSKGLLAAGVCISGSNHYDGYQDFANWVAPALASFLTP